MGYGYVLDNPWLSETLNRIGHETGAKLILWTGLALVQRSERVPVTCRDRFPLGIYLSICDGLLELIADLDPRHRLDTRSGASLWGCPEPLFWRRLVKEFSQIYVSDMEYCSAHRLTFVWHRAIS